MFVPSLGSLVADEAEDTARNIGDDELVGQGTGELVSCARDVVDEGVDVLPFRLGDDLEEAVCSSDGAVLGTSYLPSF
jgi:hypothetical protein